MMRRSLSHLLVPTLLLSPSLGRAQTAADVSTPVPSQAAVTVVDSAATPAAQPTAAGPVSDAQTVALKARMSPAPAPRVPRGNTSQSRALMIVGGVGLLVGAVIGGDAGALVMLGSTGVGLWGLYRFLN
jgi:hypothetical protein